MPRETHVEVLGETLWGRRENFRRNYWKAIPKITKEKFWMELCESLVMHSTKNFMINCEEFRKKIYQKSVKKNPWTNSGRNLAKISRRNCGRYFWRNFSRNTGRNSAKPLRERPGITQGEITLGTLEENWVKLLKEISRGTFRKLERNLHENSEKKEEP